MQLRSGTRSETLTHAGVLSLVHKAANDPTVTSAVHFACALAIVGRTNGNTEFEMFESTGGTTV